MARKNIALVITRLDLGGAQKVALYLASALSREKYNIHLITGPGAYLDPEAKEIKDISLVFMKELKHPIRPLSDLRALSLLKKYFRKNKIDIVHTHSSKAGFLGRMAAKAAKVPVVIHTVHGFSFHEYQNPVIHALYVFLERMAAKITGTLVAVGDDVVKYGLKKGVGKKEQYAVIRAGVDVELFRKTRPNRKEYFEKAGLDPSKFTVGMVGNLKKQKNPLAFVEIAKLVIDVDSDVQFVFAGDGPLRDKTNALIKKYGIGDKVKLAGWVDDREKFVKNIDVFLLTSLWEGLPCTLAEAAAASRPCVATDIGGNRELLNGLETGALYGPFDYKEAAEKIILFKNMERPEEKYTEESYKMLKEFDLKYMLIKHEELYDK